METITSTDIQAELHISDTTLWRYIHRGWIQPLEGPSGSGHHHRYNPRELTVAKLVHYFSHNTTIPHSLIGIIADLMRKAEPGRYYLVINPIDMWVELTIKITLPLQDKPLYLWYEELV